ncbi:MAG: metallophosphoesterase [Planctomycetota bacterium]
MNVFLLIIFGLPLFTVAWWLWADWRLRRARAAGWRRANAWRVGLAVVAGGHLLAYGYVLAARMRGLPPLPGLLLAEVYIWHLFVLPATVLAGAAVGVFWLVAWTARRAALAGRRQSHVRDGPERDPPAVRSGVAPGDPAQGVGAARPGAPPSRNDAPLPRLSRRAFLAATAAAVPPGLTLLASAYAIPRLNGFRVRRLEIPLTGLPAALDGLKIAHVSDTHVGRFTHGAILADIVAQANAFAPDIVCFTGDLIDHALAELPAGIEMLRELRAPHGVWACEGNHDLFEGREAFERGVRAAGIPLLINETAVVRIGGTRVQLLGLRWGRPGVRRGALIDEQMDALLGQRDTRAFPILLAHHPHAFDRAAAAGLSLTLSGHTHGGQFMLLRDVGAGSVLFKYTSGLYRNGDAALVVSNGAGNWMPLRINAPAEIGLLTLRAA